MFLFILGAASASTGTSTQSAVEAQVALFLADLQAYVLDHHTCPPPSAPFPSGSSNVELSWNPAPLSWATFVKTPPTAVVGWYAAGAYGEDGCVVIGGWIEDGLTCSGGYVVDDAAVETAVPYECESVGTASSEAAAEASK